MADQVQPKEAAPVQAAQTAPAGNGASTPKKSNTCVIIVIIVLVLLVLGGVGGYLAYRYVKGKVKNVADNATTSSNTSSSTTTTDSSSTDQEVKNNYNNTNAVTPTSDFGKTNSKVIGDILSPIFGGAKLSEWIDLNDSNSMGFLVPRKITSSDFATIESAFIAKGYSKDANYTTSDEMSVYFSNSSVEILLGCTVGEATIRTTVAQKAQ